MGAGIPLSTRRAWRSFTFIEGFYNPRRRHSTLGYRSPDRFEEDMIRKDTQTAMAVSS